MYDGRRFETRDLLLLCMVLLVALASRGWYLSACTDGGRNPGLLQVQGNPRPGDQEVLAQNLKENHSFSIVLPWAASDEPTAHLAPGYPAVLAGLDQLPFDLGSRNRSVRWVQCILGALTAGCYFAFALRAFGSSWIAALTGILCALHPFWIINTAEITDGVLATFLLGACLSLGIRAVQVGGVFSSLLFGLFLGALALVRAATLPFAVIALLWFLLRCRSVRLGWLCGLVAFLGVANGLGLWTFRNFKQFNDVVPIVDSMFLHLWEGNNPKATGGQLTDEVMLQALAEARGEDPKTVLAQLQELNQKDRYNKLAPDVWNQIRADPGAFCQRRLLAGSYFFLGADWFKEGRVWQHDKSEGVETAGWLLQSYPAILQGTLLVMFALALLGWRWTFVWRHQAMPSSLALVWLPLPYILSHAEALSGPRLPLDGILLCYAAYALSCFIAPFRSGLIRGATPVR